ncbi:MAG: YCF48-related protein [Thermoguttaceae bacterium]
MNLLINELKRAKETERQGKPRTNKQEYSPNTPAPANQFVPVDQPIPTNQFAPAQQHVPVNQPEPVQLSEPANQFGDFSQQDQYFNPPPQNPPNSFPVMQSGQVQQSTKQLTPILAEPVRQFSDSQIEQPTDFFPQNKQPSPNNYAQTNFNSLPEQISENIDEQFLLELQPGARLNAVFFVTPNKGWAVGDHGVIWYTENAGRNWVRQNSFVDCSLKDVHFFDEKNGVIVGGFTKPYQKSSEAVILKTADAGNSWNRLESSTLPALYNVEMTSRIQFQASGCPTITNPSGIFATQNNGKIWDPVSMRKSFGWTDAIFVDAGYGVGISSQGHIQQFLNNSIINCVFTPKQRKPQAISATPNRIWAVGEGGLILTCAYNSPDETLSERSWHEVQPPCSAQSARNLDFNAVFANGNDIFIAGTPGTKIFFSKDSGRTWKSADTGVTAPIRAISFTDPQNGYAVGDFGTILATNDGGQTWHTQKSGGSRSAILGIFTKSEHIPLELFAQVCAENGHLGAVEIPTSYESPDVSETVYFTQGVIPAKDRIQDAIAHIGANGTSFSWGFELENDETKIPIRKLVEQFEKDNNGTGLQRFRENLVLKIRMWQPNTLVSSDAGRSEDADRSLLVRELGEAIKAAADPNIFPEQITELGLKPWGVDKFALSLAANQLGDVNLSADVILPRLGKNIEQVTSLPEDILRADEKTSIPVIFGKEKTNMLRIGGAGTVKNMMSQKNGTKTLGFLTLVNNRFPGSTLAGGTSGNGSVGNSSVGNASVGSSSQNGSSVRQASFNSDTNETDLMKGIPLMPGTEARRNTLVSQVDQRREMLERQLTRRNNIRLALENLIFEEKAPNTAQPNAPSSYYNVRDKAAELLQNTEPGEAIRMLSKIVQTAHEMGNMTVAEETNLIIIDLYPRHPLSSTAFRWLMQYYCSYEAAWSTHRKKLMSPAFHEEVNDVANAEIAEISEYTGGNTGEYAGEYTGTNKNINFRRQSLDNAAQTLKKIVTFQPELVNDPSIFYSYAVLQRENGISGESITYFRNQALQSQSEIWAKRAKDELWLLTPDKSKLDPKDRECQFAFIRAKKTSICPFLDGKFDEIEDEKCWFSADIKSFKPKNRAVTDPNKSGPTTSQNESLGSQVMFLYDQNCLYLALRCKKASEFTYAPVDDKPRPRDPNLSKQDRVEILLDINRDYETSYKLIVDYRGRVGDECWGNKEWNPAWFVAREEDENYWYIETAIPWDSLTQFHPQPGEVWGIGLRRIVPEAGSEMWNGNETTSIYEPNGFLVFE